MNRGCLTDEVQKLANELLGRNIDTTELRLYPYIDYTIKNTGDLDYRHLNSDEREVLENLEDQHYLLITGGHLTVSREFYNYVQSVLAEAYVEGFIN